MSEHNEAEQSILIWCSIAVNNRVITKSFILKASETDLFEGRGEVDSNEDIVGRYHMTILVMSNIYTGILNICCKTFLHMTIYVS